MSVIRGLIGVAVVVCAPRPCLGGCTAPAVIIDQACTELGLPISAGSWETWAPFLEQGWLVRGRVVDVETTTDPFDSTRALDHHTACLALEITKIWPANQRRAATATVALGAGVGDRIEVLVGGIVAHAYVFPQRAQSLSFNVEEESDLILRVWPEDDVEELVEIGGAFAPEPLVRLDGVPRSDALWAVDGWDLLWRWEVEESITWDGPDLVEMLDEARCPLEPLPTPGECDDERACFCNEADFSHGSGGWISWSLLGALLGLLRARKFVASPPVGARSTRVD